MVVGVLLPDGANELAPELVAAGILILHEPLGGGNDGDTEPVENAGNFGIAGVETATRSRGTLEAGDDRGGVDILHGHDHGLVAALVGAGGNVTHVAFVLENVGEALLELRVRGNALGETGLRRIAEVGQEITDRVCHGWMFWMLAPSDHIRLPAGKDFTRRTSSRPASCRRARARGGQCGKRRSGGGSHA